jgi:hypothetical protein
MPSPVPTFLFGTGSAPGCPLLCARYRCAHTATILWPCPLRAPRSRLRLARRLLKKNTKKKPAHVSSPCWVLAVPALAYQQNSVLCSPGKERSCSFPSYPDCCLVQLRLGSDSTPAPRTTPRTPPAKIPFGSSIFVLPSK